MATYQNFKNDLLAQLANSDDADLVEMTEQLLDYTDGLIAAFVTGTPPPITTVGNSSKSIKPLDGIGSTASVDPPPLTNTGNKSNITG